MNVDPIVTINKKAVGGLVTWLDEEIYGDAKLTTYVLQFPNICNLLGRVLMEFSM